MYEPIINHDSNPYNHYNFVVLVLNQAQHDWPQQEHKQETINSQSEIAYVYKAKMNKDSSSEKQRTNHHKVVEWE